jgi:glycosyltransferase involved in cell wall biosynthesis
MKRLRILVSAYACEPGKGSEPGAGWNWVMQVARFHAVWVITRANNRQVIESAMAMQPGLQVHWLYVDLPRWARFWKRGPHGVHLYYYLWQIGAYAVARRLHHEVGFDVVHHLTFGTYWLPSLLVLLPVPFVWGPLGGAECAPPALYRTLHARGKLHEGLRGLARWLGERDPTVRLATRRAALVLAKANETAYRLRVLGAQQVHLCSEAGLTAAEWHQLNAIPLRQDAPFRLVSIGRLVHWKGFHLGLMAFARLQQQLPASEYWVIGDGIERRHLEHLAQRLAIARKVRFWGNLPRQEVLAKLAACDVLVHPSLHDSGGLVGPEAMAAGRPVICLDLGGPAMEVTEETGYKIAVRHPEQVVHDVAQAMLQLGQSVALRTRMADMARRRVAHAYTWPTKGPRLARLYEEVAYGGTPRSC